MIQCSFMNNTPSPDTKEKVEHNQDDVGITPISNYDQNFRPWENEPIVDEVSSFNIG